MCCGPPPGWPPEISARCDLPRGDSNILTFLEVFFLPAWDPGSRTLPEQCEKNNSGATWLANNSAPLESKIHQIKLEEVGGSTLTGLTS
jgi:hypothetical protein